MEFLAGDGRPASTQRIHDSYRSRGPIEVIACRE